MFEQIAGIKNELKQANSGQKRLNALVLSLTNQFNEALQANAELSRIITDLQSSHVSTRSIVSAVPARKAFLRKRTCLGMTINIFAAIYHTIIETCQMHCIL